MRVHLTSINFDAPVLIPFCARPIPTYPPTVSRDMMMSPKVNIIQRLHHTRGVRGETIRVYDERKNNVKFRERNDTRGSRQITQPETTPFLGEKVTEK